MQDYLAIEIQKDVNKAKKRLINKAKKKGLWENFGQKEVRKLTDKWEHQRYTEQFRCIDDFNIWCMDFNDKDLEGVR